MGSKQEEYACAHCGYTADGKFKGDICPECNQTTGNVLNADSSSLLQCHQTHAHNAMRSAIF